jgi:hypothetical protein
MKRSLKYVVTLSLFLISLTLSACSGLQVASGGGGSKGGGTGPFTIGGTVTGLAAGSTGLILQDNAGDNLTITANGPFTFKTSIANGLAYSVTVSQLPTPAQTCTVSAGSGKATANVTTVVVTCSTGTASIGGTVVGLLGTGLVLQDNGGDNLAVSTSGSFTFKTAIPIGNAYLVTVNVQPISPSQTCIVTGGSGIANANVGNIQVTCSTGTLSIGGTVTGLAKAGTGVVLEDNGGDKLTVTANGSFTFPTLVPAGGSYAVTILTQPSGPNQTCTVTNGSGVANANVTSVQVICPAIFHTIGGTVVGLVGTNSGMVLQNNLGDNLTISGNGTFTFNTSIADGSTYDVSEFVGPSTQPQACVIWAYQGTATSNVTSVIVDCGHNDWSWFDGSNTANQKGAFTPPVMPPPVPPPPPTFDTDSPGGRKYPATWTDNAGNLWLFGGYGLTFTTGLTPPATDLNDLWEYVGTQNYNGSYANLWKNLIVAYSGSGPAPRDGAVTWTDAAGDLWLFGGQAGTTFLDDLWKYNIAAKTWTLVAGAAAEQNGAYGTLGATAPGNFPGSRWGSNARIDSTGTIVWLFGGEGFDSSSATPGLLNDLWTYNITTNQWTWISGSKTANQTGNYGTLGTASALNVPGGRETSAAWLDAAGNFWLFGGFDLDSKGAPAALNDLWEFKAGQWTWISGANVSNQLGVYGSQGVAAATNVPGARWSSAAWTDPAGNLWLFGGQGYDSSGNGSLADLWEFTGGQWVWMKGPGSVSQGGVYGLTPGPIIYPYVGNYPGSRFAPGYWIDGNGQFWIFGGEGFDSAGANGNGLLSDLWRYLPYP